MICKVVFFTRPSLNSRVRLVAAGVTEAVEEDAVVAADVSGSAAYTVASCMAQATH